MSRFDRWMEIERNGELVELNVEYDATPIVDATYWQPAEGGEIEITAVFLNNVALDLTDAEETLVHAYVTRHHDEADCYDGPDDDYEYDRMRDDRLTGSAS